MQNKRLKRLGKIAPKLEKALAEFTGKEKLISEMGEYRNLTNALANFRQSEKAFAKIRKLEKAGKITQAEFTKAEYRQALAYAKMKSASRKWGEFTHSELPAELAGYEIFISLMANGILTKDAKGYYLNGEML